MKVPVGARPGAQRATLQQHTPACSYIASLWQTWPRTAAVSIRARAVTDKMRAHSLHALFARTSWCITACSQPTAHVAGTQITCMPPGLTAAQAQNSCCSPAGTPGCHTHGVDGRSHTEPSICHCSLLARMAARTGGFRTCSRTCPRDPAPAHTLAGSSRPCLPDHTSFRMHACCCCTCGHQSALLEAYRGCRRESPPWHRIRTALGMRGLFQLSCAMPTATQVR
jgi:hypothetical protein